MPDLGYNQSGGIIKKKFGLADRKINIRGYTLTEITLVIAIVGIMIAGVLPVFLNSITANKSAEFYSKAYKLLDSKVEQLRDTDFNSITSGNYAVPELPSGQGVLAVTNNIEGSTQVDIKKVDLTISWNFKRNQSVRLVTYITRGGIKK